MQTQIITKLNTKLIFGATAVLIIILLGGLTFSLKLYSDAQKKLENLTAPSTGILPSASPEEVKNLIKKVGNHIILPKGDPKVVTISNVEILKKDQPFFTQAKNGQKLLVYPEKVILYDPEIDKIIDIATIRLNPPASPQISPIRQISPIISPVSKYKVLLLNGTPSDTIDPKVISTLNERNDITLTVRTASSRNYQNTVITNISDRAQKIASELARPLGATIFPIATSETIPEKDIDFIIIVGEKE